MSLNLFVVVGINGLPLFKKDQPAYELYVLSDGSESVDTTCRQLKLLSYCMDLLSNTGAASVY